MLRRIAQGDLCAGCEACARVFPNRIAIETPPPILTRIFDAFERLDNLARAQETALGVGLERLARYETALGDLMETLTGDRQTG